MSASRYQRIAAQASALGCRHFRDVPLSAHTTWRIGGPADLMLVPPDVGQLAPLLALLSREELPVLVIGAGSNLLFSDAGVRGVVIKIESNLSRISIEGNRVTAEAGAWIPRLARNSAAAGLTGLEHAIGIPGTLGGLLVMNGGSRRENIGSRIVAVDALTMQGEAVRLSREECRFGYRTSLFQKGGLVVVRGELELEAGARRTIRRDMLSILRERRAKFPLKEPSCGSVFLSDQALFPQAGPPGKLIEDAGLKGVSLGDAQVSTRHANFIVNRGRATSREVASLICLVREKVAAASGVALNCEVRYVDEQCRLTAVPRGE